MEKEWWGESADHVKYIQYYTFLVRKGMTTSTHYINSKYLFSVSKVDTYTHTGTVQNVPGNLPMYNAGQERECTAGCLIYQNCALVIVEFNFSMQN